MFKLVCNTGHWETLFEGKSSSRQLRQFMVQSSTVKDGLELGIIVRHLITVEDPQRWGERSRSLILICEKPEISRTIANSIKLDLTAEILAITIAEKLDDVFPQIGQLKKFCAELEDELCAVNTLPAASLRNSALVRAVIAGLFGILIVGELFLFRRSSTPGPMGGVGPRGEAGPPGQGGEAGERGPQGPQGETRYVILKEIGLQVGDIIIRDDSITLPPGYARCDGTPIHIEDYPEYFRVLKLNTKTIDLPNVVAPNGKIYMIKLQK